MNILERNNIQIIYCFQFIVVRTYSYILFCCFVPWGGIYLFINQSINFTSNHIFALAEMDGLTLLGPSLSLYLVVFLTFMFNHIGFLVPALVGLFLFLLIILEMNFLNAINEVHSGYQLPKKVVRQIDCFQKFWSDYFKVVLVICLNIYNLWEKNPFKHLVDFEPYYYNYLFIYIN